MGGGDRAAGWATRFLAAGFDVVTTDAEVPQAVADRWPQAERLGLFPGASLERLRVTTDVGELVAADLVQVVDPGLAAPPGARLSATDETATAHEGRASLTTAIINSAGYDVLLLSEYKPTAWFGGLLALTMAAAFLAEVFILPATIKLLPRIFSAEAIARRRPAAAA